MNTDRVFALDTRPLSGRRRWAIVLVVAAMSVTMLLWSQPQAVAATSAPATTYYVALGDSIAAGYDATSPYDTYAGLVYTHELSAYPGLQPESFACSGATTTSVIAGPSCDPSAGTQLARAESFLATHRGQVALVTIDIGMNNIYDCMLPPGINTSCVANGLSQVSSQLPLILSGLKAADPGVTIVAMNYYDPFVVYWLAGDYTWALESLNIVSSLNAELSTAYASAGVAMADVYTAFQSQDYNTGYLNGVAEPQDVVTMCTWTESCQGDPHPNNLGHAVIAGAFYPLLPSGPIKS